MSELLFLSFRIVKTFFEPKEIIGGNVEIAADGFYILYAGFTFSAFDIRYFPLGHIEGVPELGLVYIHILPESPDFFSKTQFHLNHPVYFIIDGNCLLTNRQKLSILNILLIFSVLLYGFRDDLRW